MANHSLFDLSGKIALVTGSSQGIGLTLARGLAEHGARIVLNGRNEDKLTKVGSQLADLGLMVSTSVFDVTNAEATRNSVSEIESSIGPIDILVSNAGIQYRKELEEFPQDKWEELLRTNISGIFYVGQAVAKHMIPRGQGKIINLGSVQSELARPGIAPYSATKGAVRNLTRGMCADWAQLGLAINCIAPGYFRTPLNDNLVQDREFSSWLVKRTPIGRWGRVDELIGAAVFLASDASSFVNGHTLYVDGGLTVTV